MTTVTREDAARVDRELRQARPWRPLLVGMAPGRGLDGWSALTGAAGDRLGVLAGLARPPHVRGALGLMVASERVNVFETFPGDPSALGPRDADPFPLREARVLAEKLLDRLVEEAVLSNRVVVLVGAQVAAAFRHRPPFFAWERGVWDGRFYDRACMPHPRGRSRYWNDPEKVAEASAFLRGVFSGVVV